MTMSASADDNDYVSPSDGGGVHGLSEDLEMARLNMGCVPFKNEADVKEFISMNLILLDSGADTHVMRDANLVSNIYHSTCTIDTLGSTLTAELAGTLTVRSRG